MHYASTIIAALAVIIYIITLWPVFVKEYMPRLYQRVDFSRILLKNRRTTGLIAFWLGGLHGSITIMNQGFSLQEHYTGVLLFLLLTIMAATSNKWSQRTLTYKRWKLLQRCCTYACLVILIPHICVQCQSLERIWLYVSIIALTIFGCTHRLHRRFTN